MTGFFAGQGEDAHFAMFYKGFWGANAAPGPEKTIGPDRIYFSRIGPDLDLFFAPGQIKIQARPGRGSWPAQGTCMFISFAGAAGGGT